MDFLGNLSFLQRLAVTFFAIMAITFTVLMALQPPPGLRPVNPPQYPGSSPLVRHTELQ